MSFYFPLVIWFSRRGGSHVSDFYLHFVTLVLDFVTASILPVGQKKVDVFV